MNKALSSNEQEVGQAFRESLVLPLLFIGLLVFIHIIQVVFGFHPREWGIYPMHVFGLRGILTYPLVHSGFPHLFSNISALLLLGVTVMYFYKRVAVQTFMIIYLMSGILVWIFGRPVTHIGASGIVYGLVAFLFWNGIFLRSPLAIVLSLLTLMMFGSLFLGILPDQEGISWEGHLCGAIAGIFSSFWFKDELREIQQKQQFSEERKVYFLPRDTFEHKKYTPEGQAIQQDDGFESPEWYTTGTWR